MSSSVFDFPFQCFEIFTVEANGSLVGFIPQGCTFLEATMNGTNFLVFCLACSLLVYGKARENFCRLVLHLVPLLQVYLSAKGGILGVF